MTGWGELKNFVRFLKLVISVHFVFVVLKEWSVHQKLQMILFS